MAAPAQATLAEESAEETTFTLAQPVDLAAGHSANVPILDREYPAARIGLVPFLQPHPLAAIRITNDDPHSLPAGVMAVYEASAGTVTFAGDARLGGLPSGESRLLSFARDLRSTVETKQSPQPDTLTGYSVADGIVTYTVLNRRIMQITITAPVHASRDLLLEIPKSTAEQTLTVDDGKIPVAGQTDTAFRIALSVKPDETRTIAASLDQPERRTVALIDGDEAILQTITGAEKLNPSGRAALRHILVLRQTEARKSVEVERQNKLLDDVLADEDRIRNNLAAVTPTDALRSRLIRSLDADETKIEALRTSIETATAEQAQAHRDLADAVAALRT